MAAHTAHDSSRRSRRKIVPRQLVWILAVVDELLRPVWVLSCSPRHTLKVSLTWLPRRRARHRHLHPCRLAPRGHSTRPETGFQSVGVTAIRRNAGKAYADRAVKLLLADPKKRRRTDTDFVNRLMSFWTTTLFFLWSPMRLVALVEVRTRVCVV